MHGGGECNFVCLFSIVWTSISLTTLPLQGLNVAVAGIPKTIDNDIDHIDHTFGFASAVEAAQVAIRSAKTEAVCNLPNGKASVESLFFELCHP